MFIATDEPAARSAVASALFISFPIGSLNDIVAASGPSRTPRVAGALWTLSTLVSRSFVKRE